MRQEDLAHYTTSKQEVALKPEQMPVKVFISPRPSADSENAYIAQLSHSLSKNMVVLNGVAKNTSRSMDLLRHIFKADVFILNWAEDVLNLRYGLLQSFLFNIGVLLARLRGSTILWVCQTPETYCGSCSKFLGAICFWLCTTRRGKFPAGVPTKYDNPAFLTG